MLLQRASLSFWAMLLTAPAAWAHHVPVEAEVPHWNVYLWVGLGLLLILEAAFVGAMRRRGGAAWLEQAWTWMPLSILLVLGVVRVSPAFRAPVVLAEAPPDAVRVEAEARQWRWTFRYPSGASSVDELHLPAGRAVRIVLTSRDVVHSFDVPSLGIHREVVPGHPTEVAVRVPSAGRHPIFCAARCGGATEEMPGVIAVHALNEYTVFDLDRSKR